MAQLEPVHRRHTAASRRLQGLVADAGSLGVQHQRLLGELVMIRLFSLMTWLLEATAARLLCGATYLDGSMPKVLHASASVGAALANMKKHGRKKPLPFLKWNCQKDIRQNVRYLLDPQDALLTALDIHGSFMDEMRHVRNHIAHDKRSTRARFREVVKKYYGAYVNSVTPGVFLMSSRHSPTIIDRYLATSMVAARDVLRIQDNAGIRA